MSPAKVYIIDDPSRTATRKRRTATAGKRPARTPSSETASPLRIKRHGWLLALRAYALGPINLVLWPRGKGRIAWAIVGAGSLVATALLWIWWSAFFDVLARFERGVVFWVVSVVLVILLIATAWARAVATSERRVCWPRVVRHSGAVCMLGLVLPGLGLLIAGRRWKAAVAIWCAGLLVAAIVVAKHWRWLVANGVDGQGDLTHHTIEGVLCVAAGCVVFGFITWLVFAFDGVRAVSPAARSGSVANGLALALLVTLTSFLATFRPISIARELDSAAERLRQDGLRVIPLALYEFASMLDPGTPTYLAGAAMLYDELGLDDTAAAKRDLLERRAAQFAGAVGAELVPIATSEETLPWSIGPLDPIDQVPRYDLGGIGRTDAEHVSETQ
ncbi:MAG: hypothetical protein H6Q78_1203 [Candidatus Krumholzibacteriota bacterium]|nr:hypothetical protein [Candidatus Krumholzibacteriota bacterium]